MQNQPLYGLHTLIVRLLAEKPGLPGRIIQPAAPIWLSLALGAEEDP